MWLDDNISFTEIVRIARDKAGTCQAASGRLLPNVGESCASKRRDLADVVQSFVLYIPNLNNAVVLQCKLKFTNSKHFTIIPYLFENFKYSFSSCQENQTNSRNILSILVMQTYKIAYYKTSQI